MSVAPLRPMQTPLLNLLPQLAMKPVTGLARSWLSTSMASVHVQLKCWGPRPYLLQRFHCWADASLHVQSVSIAMLCDLS